mmetsp:Transcript_32398/g.39433  ORF Transcript_32398/g.39433 Transcript_32398/m.39433 type:complete len:286 (-) Transcript_32398:52-909(-)|eukprot:CAMPEP_0194385606 /NCGR_PEP_ID=MMETSP0174-20130528/81232_1 /TAXON_ID=216777 /ORGANISM="Proboscia alata, Strain PI-D3" /LENGTH=285 /DNA_ID=CAMNT_0039173893 /DNA_START=44 /DNA_END=901 /DNA_ORIENTATION=-
MSSSSPNTTYQKSTAVPSEERCRFSFSEVDVEWDFLTGSRKDEFEKWGLLPGMIVKKFQADKHFFEREISNDLLQDFLRDNQVVSKMGFPSARNTSSNRRKDDDNFNDDVTLVDDAVEVQELSCTETSTNFIFEPLVREDVLTDNGYVRACMDEDFTGIYIQDKLREMLANPSSGNSYIFKKSEQKEFLFHILRLICVGGSMCQAEDHFDAWKEAIKYFYKDLVTVVRKERSEKLNITSKVYHVDPTGTDQSIFPLNNHHNKCYAVVDKDSRSIALIYKPFRPFW